MTMTPEQIASAWALVNAATKGPWHVAGVRVKLDRQDTHAICKYDEDAKRDVNIANVWYDPKTGLGYADARFIIASRELVPQLLAALEAERAKVARLVDAARKTMAAADLREAYHRLPNDKHRIGDPKSPKGKARDAWLRSFRRAVSNTAAALTEIKETDHE